MFVSNLLTNISTYSERIAFVYQGKSYHYDWLFNQVNHYQQSLCQSIKAGDVVQLVSDYTPKTIAIFLALMKKQAIIVPITSASSEVIDEMAMLTQTTHRIVISVHQEISYLPVDLPLRKGHILYDFLKEQQHSGLVILTSGSSGKPKAIVHDVERLFQKLSTTKSHSSILSFLLFDHIGGLNSLICALLSGNTLVFTESRSPEAVSKVMNENAVNILITSPSFLNLMCLKNCFSQQSFSALKQINYGSEVMPEVLLKKLHELLPEVKLTQAYGMSELGVLPVRSENSSSLKLRINQDLVQYRIRNQLLEIKSNFSMLGYLNASSPYTEDGWLITGDRVEEDGKLLRIIGRESDMINIGGEKASLNEIEEVLLTMPEVADACVSGEPHGILGQRVVATVILKTVLTRSEFLLSMHNFCRKRLPAYKIPQKIDIVESIDYGDRFKKIRNKQNIHV